MDKNAVTPTASPQMDRLYAAGLLHPSREKIRDAPQTTDSETDEVKRMIETQTSGEKEEVMLLQRWNGKLIAEGFNLPEMEIEIERAVEQVQKAIRDKREGARDEKMIERQTEPQSTGDEKKDH